MRKRCTFLIIGFVVLLCLPAAVFAQQTLVLPATSVDGGERLGLNSATRLGITAAEFQELSAVLSEGATIELLKPVDSPAQPKDLVITKVSWTCSVDESEIEFLAGSKFLQLWYPPELGEPLATHRITRLRREAALIVLENTTKSRIDLQGWQLRITPGVIPDETDRIIDRMSNVDMEFPQNVREDAPDTTPAEPGDKLQGAVFLPSHNVSMSRKIDYASVNDAGKTRAEQLDGIPDGTSPESWRTRAGFAAELVELHLHNGRINGWIELRGTTEEPVELGKWLRWIRPEGKNGVLIVPEPPKPFIEDR